MRKKHLQEIQYLLHNVEDEDLPGKSIFLGATITRPSRISYFFRVMLATLNMTIVTFISLSIARIIPEILYSIPIYAGFIALIIYPLRKPQT